MQIRCTIIVAGLLVAACTDEVSQPVIEYSDEIAFADCKKVADQLNATMRKDSVAFFLDEVGTEVKHISVPHASHCEDRVIVAVMVEHLPSRVFL